jgi:para-nitrobenzyl esterase
VSPIIGFKQFGAFHGSEIIYVFGNLGPMLGTVVTDRNLSDKMVAYWTNFVKTGNPNGAGLPKWPAYQTAVDQHLELGAKIKIGSGLYREACDIFEDLRQTAIKNR